MRAAFETDPDFALLAASLLACIGGVLVMIATTSSVHSVAYISWTLAGLAYAYTDMAEGEAARMAELMADLEQPQTEALGIGVERASCAAPSLMMPRPSFLPHS